MSIAVWLEVFVNHSQLCLLNIFISHVPHIVKFRQMKLHVLVSAFRGYNYGGLTLCETHERHVEHDHDGQNDPDDPGHGGLIPDTVALCNHVPDDLNSGGLIPDDNVSDALDDYAHDVHLLDGSALLGQDDRSHGLGNHVFLRPCLP